MASQKTKVVEHLWRTLSAEGRTIATSDDVRDAIGYCIDNYGVKLKRNSNPFNFMKDLLRGMSANSNWPSVLVEKRITARQAMGDGGIMEFASFPDGQETPFINPFEPTEELEAVDIQSISIPLTTKTLGRNDESWLIQVAVNLRVIEQHLATKSPLDYRELTHLQVAVKLGKSSEVDALYWGVVQPTDGDPFNVVVTCEAKRDKDPILGDQIVRQVRAIFKSLAHLKLNVSTVVPIAIKSVAGGRLYVVEFEPWSKEDTETDSKEDLIVASRGLYQVSPPVPGVGISVAALKKWRRKPAI